jgi:hypothetical protein
MNHSEATMNNALPNGNLIVTEKAIDAADQAISLVRRVPATSAFSVVQTCDVRWPR